MGKKKESAEQKKISKWTQCFYNIVICFQSKLSSSSLPSIKFKLYPADFFVLQEIFLWNDSKEEMSIYCLENINSNLNS